MKTLNKEQLTSDKLSAWQLPLSFSRLDTTFSRENLFDLLFYTGQELKSQYTNAKEAVLRTANEETTKPYNPSHSFITLHKSFYNSQVTSAANISLAAKAVGFTNEDLSRYSFSIATPVYDSRARKTYKSLFDKTSPRFATLTIHDVFEVWWEYAGMFVKNADFPSKQEYEVELYRVLSEVYGITITASSLMSDLLEIDEFAKEWSLQYHDQDALKIPHFSQSPKDGATQASAAASLLKYESLARKVVTSLINSAGKVSTYYYDGRAKNVTLSGNGDDQVLCVTELTQHDEDFIVERFADVVLSKELNWSVDDIDLTQCDDPVTCRTIAKKLAIFNVAKTYLLNGTSIALAKQTGESVLFKGDDLEGGESSILPITTSFANLYDYDDSPLLNISDSGKEIAQDYVYYNSLRVSNILANELLLPLVPAYSAFSLNHIELEHGPEPVHTFFMPQFIDDQSEDVQTAVKSSVPVIEFLKAIIELTTPATKMFDGDGNAESNFLIPWLRNECCVFSGKYLGDFIDERLFKQDLTPDSDVNFGSLNIGSFNERNNYGRIDKPYLPQTVPLIDTDAEEIEGIYEDEATLKEALESPTFKFKHISKRLSSVTADGKKSVFPPTMLDIDSREEQIGMLDKAYPRMKQQVMADKGFLTVDEKIISKTTDSLWEYLKLATESTDPKALPEFFGFASDALKPGLPHHSAIAAKRILPRELWARELAPYDRDAYIDILRWSPLYNEDVFDTGEFNMIHTVVEGYSIDKYIEKPLDFKAKFFGRKPSEEDDAINEGLYKRGYEFVDDHSGYLEPVLDMIKAQLGLEDDVTLSGIDDINLLSRKKGYQRLFEIVNFEHENSRFLPYKEYKPHPKTLRILESDIEEIRMNMLALANYMNAIFVRQGYVETPKNSGSLYQLHRNYFVYDSENADSVDSKSTYISDLIRPNDDPNTKSFENTNLNTNILLPALDGFVEVGAPYIDGEDLIENPDSRVLYEDGGFQERYKHANYDSFILDLNFNLNSVKRIARDVPRPANSTSLSEVYLAADGTWRSIHEHPVAPVLDVDF